MRVINRRTSEGDYQQIGGIWSKDDQKGSIVLDRTPESAEANYTKRPKPRWEHLSYVTKGGGLAQVQGKKP